MICDMYIYIYIWYVYIYIYMYIFIWYIYIDMIDRYVSIFAPVFFSDFSDVLTPKKMLRFLTWFFGQLSGAFFYYTADGKYMMKTVTPKEFVLLRQILKGSAAQHWISLDSFFRTGTVNCRVNSPTMAKNLAIWMMLFEVLRPHQRQSRDTGGSVFGPPLSPSSEASLSFQAWNGHFLFPLVD